MADERLTPPVSAKAAHTIHATPLPPKPVSAPESRHRRWHRHLPHLFSPALVQTLIAVSSVLQRGRTALKVMMQLLVDERDVLKVGDLVPVGDSFDVFARGDEAFSQEMARHGHWVSGSASTGGHTSRS